MTEREVWNFASDNFDFSLFLKPESVSKKSADHVLAFFTEGEKRAMAELYNLLLKEFSLPHPSLSNRVYTIQLYIVTQAQSGYGGDCQASVNIIFCAARFTIAKTYYSCLVAKNKYGLSDIPEYNYWINSAYIVLVGGQRSDFLGEEGVYKAKAVKRGAAKAVKAEGGNSALQVFKAGSFKPEEGSDITLFSFFCFFYWRYLKNEASRIVDEARFHGIRGYGVRQEINENKLVIMSENESKIKSGKDRYSDTVEGGFLKKEKSSYMEKDFYSRFRNFASDPEMRVMNSHNDIPAAHVLASVFELSVSEGGGADTLKDISGCIGLCHSAVSKKVALARGIMGKYGIDLTDIPVLIGRDRDNALKMAGLLRAYPAITDPALKREIRAAGKTSVILGKRGTKKGTVRGPYKKKEKKAQG
jgi:hypothetical protein